MKNFIGEIYGLWEIVGESAPKISAKGNKHRVAICKCIKCGNIKNISYDNLRNGSHGTCQVCSPINILGENNSNFKHGKSNTSLHGIWRDIIKRCENSKCKSYKNYGGRGISICQKWRNDFISFYNWAIANGYENGLTIERKDVNGDYCPENCCWITRGEQRNNRRDTLRFCGKTLKELAKESGLKYDAISDHYHKGDLKEWLFSKGFSIDT